ncbi:S1C family serine protease [Piscinibacter sp.]|jgi:S1-C subfamily serine protease|uniref:S1C family serine protease n=1 Tax=Piscinibacter sp. TaxID=1903157 RepID=UPI003559ABD5
MKKAPLYSRSRPRAGLSPAVTDAPLAAAEPAKPSLRSPRWRTLRLFLARHPRPQAALAAVLLLVLGGVAEHTLLPAPAALNQKDVDAAVRRSLEGEPLPSPYARAAAVIRPSVVRVIGLADDTDTSKASDDPKAHTRSTGTGVVIIDNGTILTNLHVVIGSKRIKVTFFDGHESEALMIGAQPENDLAVLRAKSIPDDLAAATMRGTGDLLPGDQVVAVGFPFGIGPSVSGGVVSGLRRQFRSPDGERLSNLIQFDAAANPGNSGGPLVTMDGSVVGIVTAILNPGDQGTFIGIGFAVPIENAAAAVGLPPF